MSHISRPEWVDYTSAEFRAGWSDGRRSGKPWHGRRYGGLRYAVGYAVGAMLG
jgi:hypothetical protein